MKTRNMESTKNMEPIAFYKMSGSGNDFIVVDNRGKVVDETELTRLIAGICRRKLSVGADGVILIEEADAADFKWRFFNSDGSTAEMCGNGARCAARFAFEKGIAGPSMFFETEAGVISAQVSDKRVKIKVPDPVDLKTDYNLEVTNASMIISSVSVGVPHVVIKVENIDTAEVVQLGREIRFHEMFAPAGTNVNFVYRQKEGILAIRTYERGVEDETLACGTGAIAAAIVQARQANIKSPIKVLPRSGEYLNVYYQETDGRFYDIYLEGDARIIYQGLLCEEAWQ